MEKEQGCCGWHSQGKQASCSRAQPCPVLPAGFVNHSCGTTLVLCWIPMFFGCRCLSAGSVWVLLAWLKGGSAGAAVEEQAAKGIILAWCTDIFAISIQSRFESMDSSRLWVPSGIYKPDMLFSNKFHSAAMKSREPTSVWTLAAPALWGQLVALWYFQCAEEVKVK